jgi:hypothetical protein
VIIQSPFDPRPPIITTAATAVEEPTDAVIPSHDMRKVGLASAGRRLSANTANLDIVFVARARSDVSYCPICPIPHPA